MEFDKNLEELLIVSDLMVNHPKVTVDRPFDRESLLMTKHLLNVESINQLRDIAVFTRIPFFTDESLISLNDSGEI